MIQVKTARWWVLSNPAPQNIQRCFQNRLVAGTKNPLRDGQEEFLLQSTSPNWRCGVRSVEVGHCNADMCRRVPLNVHRYFGKVNPSNFLRWKSGHRSRDSHMTGYHHAQVSKQPDPSNPWGPQQPLHTKLEARKLPFVTLHIASPQSLLFHILEIIHICSYLRLQSQKTSRQKYTTTILPCVS